MTAPAPSNTEFIKKLREITLANISDEKFGVNELAKATGLNYFSLNRRLHSIIRKTTSQFICEIRLEKAKEILEQEEITVSEVAYRVGFGSPAYFNRCFHEHFGYPPGEIKKRDLSDHKDNSEKLPVAPKIEEVPNNSQEQKSVNKKLNRKGVILASTGMLVLAMLVSFYFFQIFNQTLPQLNPKDKSIAVLPFKSLSSDEENKYFAEGVTRSILYNLIQISEIKVINNPVEELEGNTLNLKKMAGKLNVRFFLSGSVQKSGEQVLVMAQLTDVTKNQIIWSEKYPRKLSDIFMIQSEIAKQVATNLQTVITRKENEQIEKVPTQNTEAHAWYMMGRYLLERRTWREEEINKYITPFKNAIAADPEYAEAYVGLADVYLTFTRSQSYPRPEGFVLAKENVLKALDLNSNLAEAHTTMGVILYRSEWKWEDARKELELALELNPNYAEAHRYYADLMDILRQRELARLHCFKAAELNPIYPSLIFWKAGYLIEDGKFDEAMEEYKKVIEMYPEYYSVYWYLWNLYRETGEEQKAVESLQKAFQMNADDRPFVDTIRVVYEKYGMKGLEKWNLEYGIKYDEKGTWMEAIWYYNKIGEKEKALEWIEKAFKWRIPNLPGINAISELDSLRNEPRFQALLDSMGLSAYQ